MRRTEGSMSAVAAPGAAGASGGGSRRGSRVGLGRFLVQVADLVGQLRALPDPVVDAGDVQLDALLGARGDGVVETHALDVATVARAALVGDDDVVRSEEHTSELQSLMRISYAVFCLKKKTQ